MAGAQIHSVEYDDWANGSRFRTNRRQGANDKSYQGYNMQVWDSGKLGTRPWLRRHTEFLFPGGQVNDGASLAWMPIQNSSRGAVYLYPVNSIPDLITDGCFQYNFATATWDRETGLEQGQDVDEGARQHGLMNPWNNDGDNIGSSRHDYLGPKDLVWGGQIKWDDTTATTIGWSSPTVTPTSAVFYRGRLWGWASTYNAGTRLYYTDIDDYTTMTSANQYIDVEPTGGDVYIKGCWPVNDSLLIALSSGKWYVFTGTPDTGSLRFIERNTTPAHGAAAVVMGGTLYFQAPDGRGLCSASPGGVDATTLRNIRPHIEDVRWTEFHDYRALSSNLEQTMHFTFMRDEQDDWWSSLELVNGVWCYAMYGRHLPSEESSALGELRDAAVIANEKAIAFLVEDVGNSGGYVQLNTRDIVLNRPSRSSDTYSAEIEEDYLGGNLASGAVRLAAFTPDPGHAVRVARVIVDYTYWSAAEYPTPAMSARTVTPDGETVAQATALAGASLPATGVKEGLNARHVFTFDPDDEYHRATAQLQLEGILSIGIDRVIVEYEVRPGNYNSERSI